MKDNKSLSRFELVIYNKTVYANYRVEKNIINIDYVFAPEELRGTGAAGKLMKEISENARKYNQKVHPICSYAALWLQRHREYNDIMV